MATRKKSATPNAYQRSITTAAMATDEFEALLAAEARALELERRVDPFVIDHQKLEAENANLGRRLFQRRRNKAETLLFSNALLDALSEALNYDPVKHHNHPPPDLRISDDPAFLNELRSLVAELARFNDLLERQRPKVAEAEKTAVDFNMHINTFLAQYMPMMGRGAAGLTIAAVAGLLYHAGVPEASIGGLWGLLKTAPWKIR